MRGAGVNLFSVGGDFGDGRLFITYRNRMGVVLSRRSTTPRSKIIILVVADWFSAHQLYCLILFLLGICLILGLCCMDLETLSMGSEILFLVSPSAGPCFWEQV